MSNAGRGGRPSYASNDKQWAAFERLPRRVRDALNQAVEPWAPYPIWRWWEAGKWSADELVALIKRWDRELTKKAEARRERGR